MCNDSRYDSSNHGVDHREDADGDLNQRHQSAQNMTRSPSWTYA